jgi:hypothetical protein
MVHWGRVAEAACLGRTAFLLGSGAV